VAKVSKTNAGYVFFDGTEYKCTDCYKFLKMSLNCVEVGGKILNIGGCNTFVPGGQVDYGAPLPIVKEKLTKVSAGYTENRPGFSCKRCEYFDPENWDCVKVDKESEGPAKGVIHPNGCCDFWEKDEVRGLF